MYEERKNSFSVKNVIIQFLFIALFIFILIWLFPMKNDVKNALNKINKNEDISIFYDRIFSENIVTMKDAAKSYFTTPRLPKNVGETVKITLGDMLEKKLILPFVDSNKKQCDLVDSYVEITKESDEFIMKVNLKCSEQENYILVYMGCYDYCQTTICEKNASDIKKPIINNINNNINNNNNNNVIIIPKPDPKPDPTPKPEPTPDPKPDPTPDVTKEYEYVKKVCGNWSENWTSWSESKPTTGETLKAEYRVVKITKITGYKITKQYDYSQPIYKDVKYLAGTKSVKSCTEYGYSNTGNIAYTDWVYQGNKILSYYPKDTATKKYIEVGIDNWYCQNKCVAGYDHVFEVYTKSAINEAQYTCLKYDTETVAYYGTRKELVGYKEKESLREPIKKTETVTQYRYKTRTCDYDYKNTVWSVYNDRKLLDNSYSYTGKIRNITK